MYLNGHDEVLPTGDLPLNLESRTEKGYVSLALWELIPLIGMARSVYLHIHNSSSEEKLKRKIPVGLGLGAYHGFATISLFYYLMK